IPVEGDDQAVYDDKLRAAVKTFQIRYGNRAHDGLVGPGTRRLLTATLLAQFSPNIFIRLQDPDRGFPRKVFISYSTEDSQAVNKVDQWLRDHGLRVIRYTPSFQPGSDILDRARNAIAIADKVLVAYSANSVRSDWVRSEIGLAEELERRLGVPLIVYLRLDN